jgi:uncharacterized protein YdeI (YjbR/CyaY-like superfamily)
VYRWQLHSSLPTFPNTLVAEVVNSWWFVVVARMTLKFFSTPELFRAWLEKHNAKSMELWVGYYKRDSGQPSMTWPESVDEALCFGWIDGVRKGIDDQRYMIRFTPRQPKSAWSKINIQRADLLIQQGRMLPAGMAAYNARLEKRSGIYSYEQAGDQLDENYLSQIRANPAAWKFYSQAAPSYRKAVNWWICSAKREPTRLKRLTELISDCAAGRKIKSMRLNDK